MLLPSIACGPSGPYHSSTASHRWYKGNTHTHTTGSPDGRDTPAVVADWYLTHGYDFLVLTDHDTITPSPSDDTFLLIPGEEVTSFAPPGLHHVHVNGLGLTRPVVPATGPSVGVILQANIDAIRKAGGVPQVNHPFFQQGLTVDDLHTATGFRLFELYNGHPEVSSFGMEQAWDQLLTAGQTVYGLAVDDTHIVTDANPYVSGPGRGWVMVLAASLETSTILTALEQGEFYSSTGPVIGAITAGDCALSITAKEATVQFIGKGGTVFAELPAPARYTFRGNEQYIRAKVTDRTGSPAWTQPVPVAGCGRIE